MSKLGKLELKILFVIKQSTMPFEKLLKAINKHLNLL